MTPPAADLLAMSIICARAGKLLDSTVAHVTARWPEGYEYRSAIARLLDRGLIAESPGKTINGKPVLLVTAKGWNYAGVKPPMGVEA